VSHSFEAKAVRVDRKCGKHIVKDRECIALADTLEYSDGAERGVVRLGRNPPATVTPAQHPRLASRIVRNRNVDAFRPIQALGNTVGIEIPEKVDYLVQYDHRGLPSLTASPELSHSVQNALAGTRHVDPVASRLSVACLLEYPSVFHTRFELLDLDSHTDAISLDFIVRGFGGSLGEPGTPDSSAFTESFEVSL
jgi:hypothetical protein